MNNLIKKIILHIGLTLRRPFAQKLIGGMFTQGLLSITNLIIGLLIVRQASKSEYGIFVVAFSTIMVFISIQNALVSSPLTVLLPEKKDKEKDVLLSGLGFGQWLIFIPLFILGGCILLVYQYFSNDPPAVSTILILLLVLPAALLREFFRVVNYCHLRIKSIVMIDIVFVVVALLGICIIGITDWITGTNAIIVLGIAYFLSVLLEQQISTQQYQFDIKWIKTTFKETWQYSRWALIGIAATNIQTYGYIYIITAFLSLEETANVSAARLLLVPFGLFISSSQRIFLSKGAQILNENDNLKLRRYIFSFILLFVSVWIIWGLSLWYSHDFIIESVFTSKYSQINSYLLIWAMVFLVGAFRFIITNSLQLFKEFKPLALYGSISAISVLVLCIALTNSIGSVGALIALGIGDIILLLLSLPRLINLLKEPEAQFNIVPKEIGQVT